MPGNHAPDFKPGVKGRIIQADYDFIFSLRGEFGACLTLAQITWILSMLDYAGWETRWNSSLGTPIDRAKIISFQSDLARRLMDLTEDCQEDTMFLLRQNPENPCQLEQSIDGGVVWTLAFDYSLCLNSDVTDPPLERYEEIYGGHQTSYDDGVTWVDTPDSRFKSPMTNNIWSGATDPACETSAQVVEYFKEWLDVDDEQLLLAIITILVDLIAIILTGGAAIPIVVTMAQAFVQVGIQAFQDAMAVPGEWDKFMLNLYCHAEPDGSWTLPAYYAIIDQIPIDHSGNAAFFLKQCMVNVGWIGLNNAGHLSYETTPDCSTFDCGEWCYYFDFALNDQGFTSEWGDYIASCCWEGVDLGGGNISLYATKAGVGHLTKVEAFYSFGIKGDCDFFVDAVSLGGILDQFSGIKTWNVDLDFTEFGFNPSSGASYGAGNSVECLWVRLTGTGTNPFGANNCE